MKTTNGYVVVRVSNDVDGRTIEFTMMDSFVGVIHEMASQLWGVGIDEIGVRFEPRTFFPFTKNEQFGSNGG